MMKMDLNSDLGESFGAWRMGDDAALLEVVTSANVACGFHAGDPAGWGFERLPGSSVPMQTLLRS